MSPKTRALFACVLMYGLCFATFAEAHPSTPPLTIHLRQGSFDPLLSMPAAALLLPANTDSQLMLIQLDTTPDRQTPATLAAAGMQPLAYIPDNTYLVRNTGSGRPALSGLRGVRWSGPYLAAYKLAPQLKQQLASAASADLRILATPNADVAALSSVVQAHGGLVSGQSTGIYGISLRAQIPGTAIATLLARDDILWAEPYSGAALLNDRARRILGIDRGRQELGLDGSGQIIAVTDTGLDVQANVLAGTNPDFPAKQIAGVASERDMSVQCQSDTWDDQNGHGTHVAGIILGSGASSPAGPSFAGMAPSAKLVVQSGGPFLGCLDLSNTSYLQDAYDQGARIQNASWGLAGSNGSYDTLTQQIDEFLWNHKDHLLVVAAGNSGRDGNLDGMIDSNSIISPATAKNVLSVGASENNRPASGTCTRSRPENWCWSAFGLFGAPIDSDPISDNPDGIAAFSSRGPTNDGRIKPEIVAPGTNIISTRSHYPGASYLASYDSNYAYDSGTSMAAPMVSGMAALVRQWLAEQRQMDDPSAALIKAMLVNGATAGSPGQYGSGPQREISPSWPNNTSGWGRAALTDTLSINTSSSIWLHEADDIQTDEQQSYTVMAMAEQPLRVTLAWTDYPAMPASEKALVNDLDLEVLAPDGSVVKGNASAEQSANAAGCRVDGYDRCNTIESVEVAAPQTGAYTVRVRGAQVLYGPQPFALIARSAGRGLSQTLYTIALPLIRS